MKDRQPLNPGQITITLDAASAARLGVPTGTLLGGVMARNDNPVVIGDPINKNTLLKDATAKMLGGDPDTMLPDDAIQMLAALAASGGGSGDVGDLEDTALEVGSFTNAGAGWNTYTFREAFDATPNVVVAPEDFNGVCLIKSITATGFLYCLRSTDLAVTSGSYYTATGTAASSTHAANTLVSAVSIGATTAAAVKINYLAVEYGGER